MPRKVIGIDLGTTNSVVSVMGIGWVVGPSRTLVPDARSLGPDPWSVCYAC